MESPPWHGSDEPDFMPRVRRTFADQLPSRMEMIEDAVRRLETAAGVSDPEAAEQLFSAVHNLAGTGETVGALQIGEISTRIATIARPWVRAGQSADSIAVAEVAREAASLRKEADVFLAWMAEEP